MNHSESHNRQEPWVRSNITPGLWSHPTGYWYFDKSQLMAYYDNDAKQWRMYDHFQKQWYEYSANVFFGQNPVVKGTRQQAAEEILYEPLPLYSETTHALLTKVEPLADLLRLNVDNDPSVTKPIMENIFNEINAIAGKFTDYGDPVASLLSATLIDLVKLKDYANPARDFSRITDDILKTMVVIAPAFETAIPVFYQMRIWPWLTHALAALGGALLAVMFDNARFIRSNGWKMAYCYNKSPNNWNQIETCLRNVFQLGAEDIKYCVYLLQKREESLQFAIDRGWYTPKKREREVF